VAFTRLWCMTHQVADSPASEPRGAIPPPPPPAQAITVTPNGVVNVEVVSIDGGAR
jgi:hypothetical protein